MCACFIDWYVFRILRVLKNAVRTTTSAHLLQLPDCVSVSGCYKLWRRSLGLMSEHGAGECGPHVAVEVWMAAGGRGLWIESPIAVTVVVG